MIDFPIPGFSSSNTNVTTPLGREAMFLEQFTHRFRGCSLISPSLHQQIENLAFVPHGTARTAGPQSSRPSPRDAAARLAAGAWRLFLAAYPAPTSSLDCCIPAGRPRLRELKEWG